ncbi:helix-turn-helix domain-containing protein [Merdibacter massiliensis]|uniref:helix-turn-helix domain-containing protein n=1 Tax=Merdibacter massiliensis TaxID=1871030 RepID=UPI00096A98CB|nr:helix-turn-helix domain-containing protein [Merdibacter massiliensis]
MRKLTREQKIELYEKRLAGATISELSKEFALRKEGVKYLLRLINMHGYSILRDGHCRHYTKEMKEQAILEVLNDKKSIGETAIKYGLSSKTALTNWVKDYQNNGDRVVERKRGRPRTKVLQEA